MVKLFQSIFFFQSNYVFFVSADLLVLNADIIQGITNYLKSSVGNVKFLGAYVGQLICNEINANTTGKKLDLSCCNEGANQEERNLVKEIENVISLFELVQLITQLAFFCFPHHQNICWKIKESLITKTWIQTRKLQF